jgi:DNA-binding NtrC family response regulator
MTSRRRVLVVDDEPSIRFGIREYLESHGFALDEAETAAQAEAAFRCNRPDAAVVDYSLPDGHALELMPRLKAIHPDVPLVILTGHGSIDLAVRAIKEGAEHFLTKPVEMEALRVILERSLENQRNRRGQLLGRSRREKRTIDPFLGTSPAIRGLSEEAHRVASSDAAVLIQGETGAGKGLLARWLHDHGPRVEEPFVDLNCAGLSRDFLETELFGHEKGAFTGAANAKPGLLEVAHQGTVFLDEIGDVDPQVQPKLLKVLEEKSFRRLGEVRDRHVDIRLIAAAHQDLGALAREGRFRRDLYFRISTLPLVVPPLRERREDIPPLAQALLDRSLAGQGRGQPVLAPDAVEALQAYPWPGNIRELRNVLERALLLQTSGVLERRDLRFETALSTGAPPPTDLTLSELERLHVQRVLAEEGGHVERAARRLGISRSSLYLKVRRLGLAARA